MWKGWSNFQRSPSRKIPPLIFNWTALALKRVIKYTGIKCKCVIVLYAKKVSLIFFFHHYYTSLAWPVGVTKIVLKLLKYSDVHQLMNNSTDFSKIILSLILAESLWVQFLTAMFSYTSQERISYSVNISEISSHTLTV